MRIAWGITGSGDKFKETYEAMKDFNDSKETTDYKKDIEIDIADDYLLNEGAQILSDYMLFNQNIYLSKAA